MSALQAYIDKHNAFEAIFNGTLIETPKTRAECKPLFIRLSTDLSPENLCCDGELPPAQVRARYDHLQQVWAELETIFGRKVTEAETWRW